LHEVTLIGAGNMGSAMLEGWLEAGVLKPEDVTVADKDLSKSSELCGRLGVECTAGNLEAAADSDIIVLAVKPQDADPVLGEIAGALKGDKIVVSIVAGLSTDSMRKKLGGDPSLIRVMPNLAAQVRAAASGYALDPGTGRCDCRLALRLIGAIGEAVEVEEEQLDLVTAVSGSGPAYFFLMTEALQEAAENQGLTKEVARRLARETFWGAAKVLKVGGREASVLREAVSSPGGTTVAALEVLKEAGFTATMSEAVAAARRRAGELTR
jgi:pyrroline-5-carboxylate reductase